MTRSQRSHADSRPPCRFDRISVERFLTESIRDEHALPRVVRRFWHEAHQHALTPFGV